MNNKAEIIREFRAVYSALVKVCNLANGDDINGDHIGSSEWFCDGYPFGMDLAEFTAELGAYVTRLESNK